MTLWKWLLFLAMFPRLSQKAEQSKDLNFEEKFSVLQTECKAFFARLNIEYVCIHPEHVPHHEAIYFVSNHQGTFDPVLLMACAPKPHSFISKVENSKLPIVGKWGRLIEFITFQRDDFDQNVSMLRQATRFLKEGKSLLVFPEGTRSKGSTLLPFKEGALLPAYLARVSVIPVTQMYAYHLDHAQKLTKTLKVIYGEKIDYESFKSMSYLEFSQQLKAIIQKNMDVYA